MHEVAIALEMLELAVSRAQPRRVSKLVVEIGVRSCVQPEALRFAFEVAARDTAADGAVLEVQSIPTRTRCLACGGAGETADIWARCACGCGELTFEGGDELRLREIEVE